MNALPPSGDQIRDHGPRCAHDSRTEPRPTATPPRSLWVRLAAGTAALTALAAVAVGCAAGSGTGPSNSSGPSDTAPSVVATVPAVPGEDFGPSTVGAPGTPPSSTGTEGQLTPPASQDADAGSPAADAPPNRPFGPKHCRLDAPKVSEDLCSTDADCGPSDPCHAAACVAKAKSSPPGPGIMCTRILRCDTADANRCGCYQGHCALIPPSP